MILDPGKTLDDLHTKALMANAKDAARWRAFVRVTGNECDMSTGPWSGAAKDLHVTINCTGCAKFLESGAPDYVGTLNAAMDDEIRTQADTRDEHG